MLLLFEYELSSQAHMLNSWSPGGDAILEVLEFWRWDLAGGRRPLWLCYWSLYLALPPASVFLFPGHSEVKNNPLYHTLLPPWCSVQMHGAKQLSETMNKVNPPSFKLLMKCILSQQCKVWLTQKIAAREVGSLLWLNMPGCSNQSLMGDSDGSSKDQNADRNVDSEGHTQKISGGNEDSIGN